jgi:hypothetical protein
MPIPHAAFGRLQGLHRRFDLAVCLAHAQGVAGPVQTPIVGVVVGVRDPERRGAGRTGGVPAEPPLDRVELVRIELPLYLPVIRSSSPLRP